MKAVPNSNRDLPFGLLGLLGLLMLLISGCAYESYLVNGNGEPAGHPGRCTLLFEPAIQVWSDFDGLVLPDVETSIAASTAALSILTREYEARSARQLRLVTQPSANQQLLYEHLALATLVIDQALLMSGSSDPRWWHKHGRTDLGIGPGLDALISGSNCGSVMLLTGFQMPATGIGPLPGRAVLTLGSFDIESGQIIQARQIVLGAGQNLWHNRDLQLAIEGVLKGLPL